MRDGASRRGIMNEGQGDIQSILGNWAARVILNGAGFHLTTVLTLQAVFNYYTGFALCRRNASSTQNA